MLNAMDLFGWVECKILFFFSLKESITSNENDFVHCNVQNECVKCDV